MKKVKCRDCACADIINDHLAACLVNEDKTYDPDKKRDCRYFENKEESQRLRVKLCLEGIDSALEILNEEIA